MMRPGLPSLDPRKAAILRAIVREYVRVGQPVGSRILTDRYRLRVSAATVRNDMAVLEELGFISQPHTSAGRVPTDLGYRWFLDNYPPAKWPELSAAEQKAMERIVRKDVGGLDEALDSTSHVLSEITETTSVVVAPPTQKNRLRRLELLPRPDGRATLLLIADTGVVRQGVVDVPGQPSPAVVEELGQKLSAELEGEAFEALAEKATSSSKEGQARADAEKRAAVAGEIARVVAASTEERIFRGGTAKILSPDKFSDLATAHAVIEALENPPVLSELLDAARKANTLLVFIGHEVPVEEMHACAVVFAPYEVDSERVGSLGVIGPTRMDYPHTIAAVKAAAVSLSESLDSGSERG